jgi:hypothetical protein
VDGHRRVGRRVRHERPARRDRARPRRRADRVAGDPLRRAHRQARRLARRQLRARAVGSDAHRDELARALGGRHARRRRPALGSPGDRPIAIGFGAFALDDFPLDDPYGARTFRNLGADALLTAHDGDDKRFTLAFGYRSFVYKPPTEPAHLYDYNGPAINARMDFVLWQPDDRTRSLELVTNAGFESRTYTAFAYADACPPGEETDPTCQAATMLARHDRASRAGVELTYSGREILQIGYQFELIDSNSFGNSFARHRILASGTVGIGKVYISLLAILQLDQYLDGLLVENNIVNQSFASVEDEDRSSAQLHVTRAVSKHWSVEGRVAYWRNIGNTMDLQFSRAVVYGGVTCAY